MTYSVRHYIRDFPDITDIGLGGLSRDFDPDVIGIWFWVQACSQTPQLAFGVTFVTLKTVGGTHLTQIWCQHFGHILLLVWAQIVDFDRNFWSVAGRNFHNFTKFCQSFPTHFESNPYLISSFISCSIRDWTTFCLMPPISTGLTWNV